MSYAAIKELLREVIGLDAASLGAGAIERAVRERQLACRLGDVDVYCARAQ